MTILEKVAQEYWQKYLRENGTLPLAEDAFLAGAAWQREQWTKALAEVWGTDSEKLKLFLAEYTEMDEDDRLKEAFLDMLYQSCAEYRQVYDEKAPFKLLRTEFVGYDSMCLSAYENALSLAVEFGWIKKEEVLR